MDILLMFIICVLEIILPVVLLTCMFASLEPFPSLDATGKLLACGFCVIIFIGLPLAYILHLIHKNSSPKAKE